ncbi:hypothetical protein JYU34_012522 [Plutella xylostella]|uniref:Uncharacterized protein n=1 Tax=Plutella xylostella TaxID=51655 RepID=A0ABQ7QF70_PLUXY|nr:hypothetical protein JYU34_012522 [Plutella xylostella]
MASLVLMKSVILSKALQRKRKIKTKMITNKICRVCREPTADAPIFNNCLESYLAKEILYFSGVTISKLDKFPHFICDTCYKLLHGCILFRHMCRQSDKAFRKTYSTIVKHQNPPINVLPVEVKIEECVSNDSFENDMDANSAEENDFTANNINEMDANDRVTNYTEANCTDANKDEEIMGISGSVDSSNVPSPPYSETGLWDCTDCSKDFHNMASYNKHLTKCKAKLQHDKPDSTEVSKKQYLCETCGKSTPSRSNLESHKKIHYNFFPHACDLCPYKGRTKSLLNLHKKTHLEVKPFKCMLCPRTMTSTGNLKKHMDRIHSTTSFRPFKCTSCDKTFKMKSDLKRHYNAIHENRGYAECEICKKVIRQKHIRKHLWRIHKIQQEKSTLPNKLPSYILCSRTAPVKDSV